MASDEPITIAPNVPIIDITGDNTVITELKHEIIDITGPDSTDNKELEQSKTAKSQTLKPGFQSHQLKYKKRALEIIEKVPAAIPVKSCEEILNEECENMLQIFAARKVTFATPSVIMSCVDNRIAALEQMQSSMRKEKDLIQAQCNFAKVKRMLDDYNIYLRARYGLSRKLVEITALVNTLKRTKKTLLNKVDAALSAAPLSEEISQKGHAEGPTNPDVTCIGQSATAKVNVAKEKEQSLQSSKSSKELSTQVKCGSNSTTVSNSVASATSTQSPEANNDISNSSAVEELLDDKTKELIQYLTAVSPTDTTVNAAEYDAKIDEAMFQINYKSHTRVADLRMLISNKYRRKIISLRHKSRRSTGTIAMCCLARIRATEQEVHKTLGLIKKLIGGVSDMAKKLNQLRRLGEKVVDIPDDALEKSPFEKYEAFKKQALKKIASASFQPVLYLEEDILGEGSQELLRIITAGAPDRQLLDAAEYNAKINEVISAVMSLCRSRREELDKQKFAVEDIKRNCEKVFDFPKKTSMCHTEPQFCSIYDAYGKLSLQSAGLVKASEEVGRQKNVVLAVLKSLLRPEPPAGRMEMSVEYPPAAVFAVEETAFLQHFVRIQKQELEFSEKQKSLGHAWAEKAHTACHQIVTETFGTLRKFLMPKIILLLKCNLLSRLLETYPPQVRREGVKITAAHVEAIASQKRQIQKLKGVQCELTPFPVHTVIITPCDGLSCDEDGRNTTRRLNTIIELEIGAARQAAVYGDHLKAKTHLCVVSALLATPAGVRCLVKLVAREPDRATGFIDPVAEAQETFVCVDNIIEALNGQTDTLAEKSAELSMYYPIDEAKVVAETNRLRVYFERQSACEFQEMREYNLFGNFLMAGAKCILGHDLCERGSRLSFARQQVAAGAPGLRTLAYLLQKYRSLAPWNRPPAVTAIQKQNRPVQESRKLPDKEPQLKEFNPQLPRQQIVLQLSKQGIKNTQIPSLKEDSEDNVSDVQPPPAAAGQKQPSAVQSVGPLLPISLRSPTSDNTVDVQPPKDAAGQKQPRAVQSVIPITLKSRASDKGGRPQPHMAAAGQKQPRAVQSVIPITLKSRASDKGGRPQPHMAAAGQKQPRAVQSVAPLLPIASDNVDDVQSLTVAAGQKQPRAVQSVGPLLPSRQSESRASDKIGDVQAPTAAVRQTQPSAVQSVGPTLPITLHSPTSDNVSDVQPPTAAAGQKQPSAVQSVGPLLPTSLHNRTPDEVGIVQPPTAAAAKKRPRVFQSVAPLVVAVKKPKLTIKLLGPKDDTVKEVTEEPAKREKTPDKHIPVHKRPDIRSSTDETVVRYLAFWPWKSKFRVKKTVGPKASKSSMIIDEQDMLEGYQSERSFIKIVITKYPPHYDKEDIFDLVFDAVAGESFIPSFIEFTREECKFLVLRSVNALLALHKKGLVLQENGVVMPVHISLTHLTLSHVGFIPRLVLAKRLTNAFDGEATLDLEAFCMQSDVSHFVYFPLSRPANQAELTQLDCGVSWTRLAELNLANNRLRTIEDFDLLRHCPKLRVLDLSQNHLERVTALLCCRGLPLTSLWLEGNPLCTDYTDPVQYVRVLRIMFSTLTQLDGVKLTLVGELPDIWKNYCPASGQALVERFLELYFPLLDSAPEDRLPIEELYHEQATLTVTYSCQLRNQAVFRHFRNMFSRCRQLEEENLDSVQGAAAIAKHIARWPALRHDPYTIHVDVLHHDEATTVLCMGGVLKITSESLAEDQPMLSFSRSVLLHSHNGSQYRIHNEMLYWDEATPHQVDHAFQITSARPKKLDIRKDSAPDDDLKENLIAIFMKLTDLTKKRSERCLDLRDWDFRQALEYFMKLLELNGLHALDVD